MGGKLGWGVGSPGRNEGLYVGWVDGEAVVGISVGMKDGTNVGERVVGLAVGLLDILGAIVEGCSMLERCHYWFCAVDNSVRPKIRTDLWEKLLVPPLD